MYKFLSSKGIKSLLPRHLNQDPLENLFGALRSLGCSKPTCGSFIMAYKTLLLNNLVSAHSPGANCEDFTEGTLSTYKNFFTLDQEMPDTPIFSCNLPCPVNVQLSETTKNLQTVTHSYISGFIIKKLNKDVLKGCVSCLKKMCTDEVSNDHELIVAREYQPTKLNLKYPGTSFCSVVNKIISYINDVLPKICHHQKIQSSLITGIMSNVNISNLSCPAHEKDFTLKIVKYTIKLFIHHWCTEINKILSGKQKLRAGENDPIKLLANKWHSSHSKKLVPGGKFNLVI